MSSKVFHRCTACVCFLFFRYVIAAYHNQESPINFRFTTDDVDPSNDHIKFISQVQCDDDCRPPDMPEDVDASGLRGLVDFCYSGTLLFTVNVRVDLFSSFCV